MVGGLSIRVRIPMLITVAVVSLTLLATPAKAPTPPPQHGLAGSYYISNWDKDVPPPAGPYAQVWRDPNDFSLPEIFTAPVATRVDAQVAFGQGKGFSARNPGPPVIWWPTASALPAGWTDTKNVWNYFAAVIWKGYIHLPKAGTYYFATVSNGASAVYLNQARVALNGNFGGALVSDAFTYAKESVQDYDEKLNPAYKFTARPRDTYVIPVLIDAPRDLPIEVRYNPSAKFTHWASEPFGIDLFWVPPDSSRDDKGKPIASMVPSDALYTEPPGPIEKPVVRSANSTIAADHLYFPAQGAEGAVALTIRLADKDGNPVPDKRVLVTSLNDGNPDAIVQPDKPTDKNGQTVAKIRTNVAYPVAHESTILATDLTDFVDASQVAHVIFQQTSNIFFDDPYSPYYDPAFSVTPLPPVVGRPATIKTRLKNRSEFSAVLTVKFLTTDYNIGLANWAEIAKVDDLKLQPGESREVSTSFTPKEVMGHKCYRVEVQGRFIAMNPSGAKVLAAALLPSPAFGLPTPPNPPEKPQTNSQQINTSTVAPQSDCKDACQTISDMLGLVKEYGASSICPGPCANFTNKFDPLLHGLRDVDLPCCFNAGADPACASLLQQIHRDRFGLKTLSSSIMFPSQADCFSGTPARCDDYNAIQRIQENLNRLGGILGCVAGKHQPHLACPEMEALEKIKEHVERDKKLTHLLSEHARKNDPELTKGFEDAEKGFEGLASFLSKLITLGKSCEEIKKILSELQALFNAIDEINNAGCNTQQVARGFDDLVKAAAALAGNLPIVNWSPELAGIVEILAQDKNFFENMSCALNPECRWRREFQNVDGYIPDCPSVMGSSPQ